MYGVTREIVRGIWESGKKLINNIGTPRFVDTLHMNSERNTRDIAETNRKGQAVHIENSSTLK